MYLKNNSIWSITLGLSILLVVVGILSLGLFVVIGAFNVQLTIQFTSFCFLLAWLLAIQQFYPEFFETTWSLISLSFSLITLIFGYVVAWFCIHLLDVHPTLLISLSIYFLEGLFLLAALYSPNGKARARFADDLIGFVWIVALLIMAKAAVKPETYASASIIGWTTNFFRDINPVTLGVLADVMQAVSYISITEFYVFSLSIIWILNNNFAKKIDIFGAFRLKLISWSLIGLGLIIALIAFLPIFGDVLFERRTPSDGVLFVNIPVAIIAILFSGLSLNSTRLETPAPNS